MKNISLLSFLLIFTTALSAQAELVTDFFAGEEDGFDCFLCLNQPTAKLPGGLLIFAQTAENGREPALLANDSLFLLKDINPGAADSRPDLLVERGDSVYFSALNAESGGAVWVTDGTEAGTTLFFDPDDTDTSRPITDFKFGADGALYVVHKTTLYRFANGEATELADRVTLSTSFDNDPGGSFTAYGEGVAYISKEDEGFGGGLYAATDTVRLLASIPDQSRFDAAFGLRVINGSLLFTTNGGFSSPERTGTFIYTPAADSLRKLLAPDGTDLFISRWYTISDRLHLGLRGSADFYLFDGLNDPSLFYEGEGLSLVARQVAPSANADSLFIWQTSSGGFGRDENISITNGTVANTSTILEGDLDDVSNLIVHRGYLYFTTNNGSFDPVFFYRYNLASGELVNFFESPERTDFRSYSVQLVSVEDSLLYFTSTIDPTVGRELYSVPTGLDVTSVFSNNRLPQLDVAMTSETYSIRSQRSGSAMVSVFDLGGGLISQEKVSVNSTQSIRAFRGMRIYVFEFDGRRAVRRVIGR